METFGRWAARLFSIETTSLSSMEPSPKLSPKLSSSNNCPFYKVSTSCIVATIPNFQRLAYDAPLSPQECLTSVVF